MDAKNILKKHKKNNGQSLLEFAILLPIIVLMIQILIETESAISTAIVNQKFARGTLHFLMFNHRNYPEFQFAKKNDDGNFKRRYWVGVDDHVAPPGQNGTVKPYAPVRPIGLVKRLPSDAENEPPQSEYPDIQERKYLRIRPLTYTCLPPLAVNQNGLLAEGNMREDTFLQGGAYGEICSPKF